MDSRSLQTIAVVTFCDSLMSEPLVPIIGNYRMDVHQISGEDSIFPLPIEHNNKTKYAAVAQSVERILGKDSLW